MPTIVHFEVPSDNLERTKRFYTELLDGRWRRCKAWVRESIGLFPLQVATEVVVVIIVMVVMAVVVVLSSGRLAVE